MAQVLPADAFPGRRRTGSAPAPVTALVPADTRYTLETAYGYRLDLGFLGYVEAIEQGLTLRRPPGPRLRHRASWAGDREPEPRHRSRGGPEDEAVLLGVRARMAAALARLRELEEQVQAVPELRRRLQVLQEEKRMLLERLRCRCRCGGGGDGGTGIDPDITGIDPGNDPNITGIGTGITGIDPSITRIGTGITGIGSGITRSIPDPRISSSIPGIGSGITRMGSSITRSIPNTGISSGIPASSAGAGIASGVTSSITGTGISSGITRSSGGAGIASSIPSTGISSSTRMGSGSIPSTGMGSGSISGSIPSTGMGSGSIPSTGISSGSIPSTGMGSGSIPGSIPSTGIGSSSISGSIPTPVPAPVPPRSRRSVAVGTDEALEPPGSVLELEQRLQQALQELREARARLGQKVSGDADGAEGDGDPPGGGSSSSSDDSEYHEAEEGHPPAVPPRDIM